mmetsp:Transcript_7211/g.23688  ORF Transcript_7211/g.23688 Transcript_7211/m.23688 type:complete len:193 (-) Transcript_7211:107-685(-)
MARQPVTVAQRERALNPDCIVQGAARRHSSQLPWPKQGAARRRCWSFGKRRLPEFHRGDPTTRRSSKRGMRTGDAGASCGAGAGACCCARAGQAMRGVSLELLIETRAPPPHGGESVALTRARSVDSSSSSESYQPSTAGGGGGGSSGEVGAVCAREPVRLDLSEAASDQDLRLWRDGTVKSADRKVSPRAK